MTDRELEIRRLVVSHGTCTGASQVVGRPRSGDETPRFSVAPIGESEEVNDHSFRLPTSTGVSRVAYRFSNLALAYDRRLVPVGLAPNFASPGVPMDAYGRHCHELYRDITG